MHWYHHTTVLIYCWYSYKDFAASGRWFMGMNFPVHAIMYSYFALKSMRVRVPVFVSSIITSLQIVQMIFGCYVNWVAYKVKSNSPQSNCHISDNNVFYSFLMYLSYFALFFQFFLDAYIKSNAKHKLRQQEKEKAIANGNGNGNGHCHRNGELNSKKSE